jgi:hypothetical protein
VPMDALSKPDLSIAQGTCYLLFAYDVARAIDLDEAERHVVAMKQREVLKLGRRAPKYIEYRPPPLRIAQDITPMVIGDFRSGASVDLVLYDFGAISVTYTIALMGPLSGLLTLSNELYEATLLLVDSRKHVEQLLTVIGSAVSKPNMANVVEDYAIYHIEAFTPPYDINDLCMHYAQDIAQILRAENQPLSQQEVTDALAYRLSFGVDDVTIVDWNAALLVDREGDDVRTVLEFANVELLELRYLDRSLDDALDRSYEVLTMSQRLSRLGLGGFGADRHHVARMQVDSAILFEGVNNALKLLGDQYLSRVYRLVSQRFHLAEWDAGILRKLQTLDSIHEKMSDQATTRRMEVLEWIIIILIAISIILPFLPGGYGH